MEKTRRRVLGISIFILMSVLFLFGCGAREKSEAEADSSFMEEQKEALQSEFGKTSHYDLQRKFELAAANEQTIVGCYEKEGKITLAYYNKAAGSIEKEVSIPSVSEIQGIDIDSKGNVYVTAVRDYENVFLKVDQEGVVQDFGDIVLEDTDHARYIMPKGLYVDDSGNFYAWYEMGFPLGELIRGGEAGVNGMVYRIYVKDSQMNTLFYEQVLGFSGSDMLSFTISASGIPVILGEDDEEIFIRELDVEKRSAGRELRLDSDTAFQDIGKYVGIVEDSIWFYSGDSIYRYGFDGNGAEKVLNLSAYGIFASDILYADFSDNEIEIIDNHSQSNTELSILEKGQDEKTTLYLGTVMPAQQLEKAVTEFNRYNQSIRVQIIRYYDGEQGYEAGVEELKQELVSGTAPDILDVSDINYEMLIEKKALEDLFAYMADDRECSADILMDSVLDSYTINGQLFTLAPAFQLYSMWGKTSVFQGQSGITLSELKQILQRNGKDINAVFGFSADEPILTTLCTFGMNEFIDWETAVCDFENDYFTDILDFAKEYDGGYKDGSYLEGIQENEILIYVGIIRKVADYQIEKELFGEELCFIGYPTDTGSGTALSYYGSEISINSSSEHKEQAWEFVKFYLLNGYDNLGFPTVKQQFEACMDMAMQKEYITDSYNDATYEVAKGYYSDGQTFLEVFDASQQDVDAVRNLVNSAKTRYKYNVSIMNIINEEAESYFAGQKDVEEVEKIIQNRVQLYLQEQVK